jgi:hypothetical protein
MSMQHALQANGREVIACFGVVRLFDLAEGGPSLYYIHGPIEHFESDGFALMLETQS